MQGIKGSFDYKKILKALKKEYCCNGTVVEDEELGQVIQVQGDQRKNIADFLTTVRLHLLHLLRGSAQLPVFCAVSRSAHDQNLDCTRPRCSRYCTTRSSRRLNDDVAQWQHAAFLIRLRAVQNKIVKKDLIKVHGF